MHICNSCQENVHLCYISNSLFHILQKKPKDLMATQVLHITNEMNELHVLHFLFYFELFSCLPLVHHPCLVVRLALDLSPLCSAACGFNSPRLPPSTWVRCFCLLLSSCKVRIMSLDFGFSHHTLPRLITTRQLRDFEFEFFGNKVFQKEKKEGSWEQPSFPPHSKKKRRSPSLELYKPSPNSGYEYENSAEKVLQWK